MGVAQSFLSEIFPPKSKYSVDDTPDLTGKVIIVTGSNTGIGKETAKASTIPALLEHGAKVYIAARNEEKAELAIADLKEQTGKEGIFLKLDLADLQSIKCAAEEFMSKEKALHVLFNNGGVMVPPIDQLTAQGYDLQFGTNFLGHFYFTKLLLPALISGAKSSPDGKARVVNTTSAAHIFASGLDFNTFKDGPKRRSRFVFALYAQSKYANIVFASELARRYGGQGIVSTAVNPGSIRSDLTRHLPRFSSMLAYFIIYPTCQGALTQLWAGTSTEGEELNGKYLVPWARIGTPRAGTRDPELGRQLWAWAEEQVAQI